MFERDNGGIDVDFQDTPEAASDVTRLVLDAEIGVGEVRVEDLQGDFEFHDGRFRGFEGGDFTARDERAVCEGTGERASG